MHIPMPVKVLFFSLLILSASGSLACGVYEVNGVVRSSAEGYGIVVNEGTKSEVHLSVPVLEAVKMFSFKNQPVKCVVQILKPIDGTHASIDQLVSIDLRVPDPLHPALNTYVRLNRKLKCN